MADYDERARRKLPARAIVAHDRLGTTPGDEDTSNKRRPYNIEVAPGGRTIYRGGTPETALSNPGAHAVAWNPRSVGISYGGGLGQVPDPAAMYSLQQEAQRIQRVHGDLSNGPLPIVGHGQADALHRADPAHFPQATLTGRDAREAAGYRNQLMAFSDAEAARRSAGLAPGELPQLKTLDQAEAAKEGPFAYLQGSPGPRPVALRGIVPPAPQRVAQPSPFAAPQEPGTISSVPPPTGEAPMAGGGGDSAPISPGLEMAANPPGGNFGDTSVAGWDTGARTAMPGTILGPADAGGDGDVGSPTPSPMERFVPGYEPITEPSPEPQVASATPSQPPSQSKGLKQQVQDLLPDWLKGDTAKDAVKAATTAGPGGGPTPLQQITSPFAKPGQNDLHANAVAAAQKGSMATKGGGQKQPTLSDALNKYAMAGISSPLPSQMQPRKPVPIYG